jgi:RNA polymerase II-associated factor 1
MKTEHDSFLAYYLTQGDDSAITLKGTRASVAPYTVPGDQEPTLFQFVRDYETIKVEQNIDNEFLLVLWDGDEPAKDFKDVIAKIEGGSTRRERGAYYKNIERKMLLKKKRVNVSACFPSCRFQFHRPCVFLFQ